MPKILVTGLNRSGTSAFSNLLSRATGASLWDDPEWAISGSAGCLSYQQDALLMEQMKTTTILKCPRMCERLGEYLDDFPASTVFLMLRDPRDVWASILEKVTLGRATRMLDNSRFGEYSTDIDGYILQAQAYFAQMELALDTRASVHVVSYARFVQNKVAFISAAAHRCDLFAPNRLPEFVLDTQLGPRGHKADPDLIRGPDRWMTDISATQAGTIWAALGEAYARLEDRSVEVQHV